MSDLSTSDRAAEIEERLRKAQKQRIAAFGDHVLLWLAAVPVWTSRLARAANFPTEHHTLKALLDDAEDAGICDQVRAGTLEQATWLRINVRIAIAPYAPEVVEEALGLAATMEDASIRARVLSDLSPHLDDNLRRRAIVLAEDLSPLAEQVRALTALARFGTDANQVIDRALQLAERIDAPVERTEALIQLLPQLDRNARDRAARAAASATTAVPTAAKRAQIISALAPYLPRADVQELVSEALEDAKGRDDWAAVSASLAPLAPASRVGELLAALRHAATAGAQMRPNVERAAAAIAVAAAQVDDWDEAISATESIAGRTSRARAYARLIVAGGAHADDRLLARLVDRAVVAASMSADSIRSTTALSAVAASLVSIGRHDRAVGVVGAAAERSAAFDREQDTDAAAPSPDVAQRQAATLKQVAELQAAIGDVDDAIATSERALRVARRIGDPRLRCSALLSLSATAAPQAARLAVDDAAEAAQAIADLRARTSALTATLEHVDDERQRTLLIEQALDAADAADEHTFWMPDAARPEIVDDLRERLGPKELRRRIVEIADALQEASGIQTPPAVVRWKQLAAEARPAITGSARFLERRVSEALNSGDVAEALAWIDTGAALSTVLRGDLEAAVRSGSRRIELRHRRTQDARRLRYFVERTPQIEAFKNLLSPNTSATQPWGLHYLGGGGSGKTMLLRHLARVAAEQRYACARVDFDYLDPGFPARRPGALLLDLIWELQAYAQTTQQERIALLVRESAIDSAVELAALEDPLEALDTQMFQKALSDFCDFLSALQQPVVLMLDTCEELERLEHPGGRLPSVEAAFRILEKIHERMNSGRHPFRVVFAGRRPLSAAGADWTLHGGPATRRGARLPSRRPWLRLHRVRGFDRGEAADLLRRVSGRELDAALIGTVLAQSVDETRIVDIDWTPPQEEPVETRYNPWVLWWHAESAREEPGLTAESLASGGTELYIRRRVLDRQPPNVVALLRAAVPLRRFDKPMIRPALPGLSDADFDEAFRALSAHDWIDYRRDRINGNELLELDLGLRLQLEKLWQPSRGDELTSRLGSGIAALIERSACSDLNFEHVAAAFRLLPPEHASHLWHRLEQRVVKDCAWEWAAGITDRLLAVDGPVDEAGGASRAAVLATNIAAARRSQPAIDIEAAWRSVRADAAGEPDAQIRSWLESRATVGLFAAHLGQPQEVREAFGPLVRELCARPQPADELEEYRRDQLQGGVTGAISAFLDGAEGSDVETDVEVLNPWLRANGEPGSTTSLRCWANLLLGRLHAARGRTGEAAEAFAAADDEAVAAATQPSDPWLDAPAPKILTARVRLEALRAVSNREPTKLGERIPLWERDLWGDAPTAEIQPAPLESIDVDRLASRLLARRLAAAPPPRSLLHWLEGADVYRQRAARCAAHERTLPLGVQLAQAWISHGDGKRAWAELTARIDEATAAGDTATVRAVRHGQLALLRRLRADTHGGIASLLAASPLAEDQEVAWPFRVLALPITGAFADSLPLDQSFEPTDPAALHRWWRCQPTRHAHHAATWLSGLVIGHAGQKVSAFLVRALELDRLEASYILEREVDPAGLPAATTQSPTPDEEVRLALREFALRPADRPRALAVAEASALAVGARQVAEVALDEGELLALRLPGHGARLLELAAEQFKTVGDEAGSVAAGAAAALALIRADRVREARTLLDARVRPAYERLVVGPTGPDAPRWKDLDASKRRGVPDRPDWDGWHVRLRAAVAASRRWPFARRISDRGYAELKLAQVDRRTPVRDAVKRVLSTAAPIAILLAVVGAAVSLPILTGVLVATHSWDELRYTLLLLGAWVVALGGRKFFKTILRAYWAAKAPATIRVELDERVPVHHPGWPPPSAMTMTISQRRTEPRLQRLTPRRILSIPALRRRVNQTGHLVSQWPHPYADLQPMMPTQVSDELRELARISRGRRLRIKLVVDASVAGLPWEAIIARHAFDSPHVRGWHVVRMPADSIDLRETRHSPVQAVARPRFLENASARAVAVISAPAWRTLAQHAWLARGYNVDDVTPLDLDRAAVVHVLAAAVPSPNGPVLSFGGTATRRGAGRPDQRQLVRPERLQVRGSVVVLQGEPLDGTQRQNAERSQTADLRVCAAALMDAGARSVVMIPSMSSELAHDALDPLIRAVQPHRLQSAQALVKAVEDVRGIVSGLNTQSGGQELPDRRELALDICVFSVEPAFP